MSALEPIGVWDSKVRAWARTLPMRAMIALVVAWVLLAIFNLCLILKGLEPGTPTWFPISVFYGPRVRPTGLPFSALFVVAIIFVVRRAHRWSAWQVWTAGVVLIVLGNLAQGGPYEAFYGPFYASDIQYYSDANQVGNWKSWLAAFNDRQATFLNHTRTHPPFAVLIHCLFTLGLDKPLGPAIAFILISTLSIPLFRAMLVNVGVKPAKASRFAMLFGVLPACNVYCAVSLDGVIATVFGLCLLGLLQLVNGRGRLAATLTFVIGFLLANLLTFGAVFLVGVAFAAAVWEMAVHRRRRVAAALLISAACSVVLYALLWKGFGYDHVRAFLTAATLENSHGFFGFSDPLAFAMTRVEGICEIVLFLSISVAAVLLHPRFRNGRSWNLRDAECFVCLAGVGMLLSMMAAGVYRTGETARACLFIYPYLLLPLRHVRGKTLDALIVTAGLQTAIMQTFGDYCW